MSKIIFLLGKKGKLKSLSWTQLKGFFFNDEGMEDKLRGNREVPWDTGPQAGQPSQTELIMFSVFISVAANILLKKVWPMLAIWTNAYFIYSQKSLEPFHFSIDSEIAQKPLDKWVTPQMVYSVKWGDRAEAMGLWDCHDECLFVFLMLYWTCLTTQKGY